MPGSQITPVKVLHFSHPMFIRLSISSRTQALDVITEPRYLKWPTAFRGVVLIHGGCVTPVGELDRLQCMYVYCFGFVYS